MHLNLNHDLLWKILVAVVELGVASLLGSLIKRIMTVMIKKAKNKGVLTFFASFINIFFKVIGLVVALDQLGVSMNLIVGALSALGVGISLALKDNMASVASGLQILLTRPFQVGDYIRMGKHEGKVISIEITFTTLLTPGNQIVIVPNNSLIIKCVTNYSNQLSRKIDVQMPCASQDVETYQMILMEAAKKSPLVLTDPVPVVTIQSLDDKSVVLQLECYTDHAHYTKCYSQIMKNIHEIRTNPKEVAQLLKSKSSTQDHPQTKAIDAQNHKAVIPKTPAADDQVTGTPQTSNPENSDLKEESQKSVKESE